MRIFAKGANWVPPDQLEALETPERLRRLVATAAATNMNYLRVWGGGVYPQDAFYDACDEYGILLQQDAIFSDAAYPTDEAFVAQIAAEGDHQAWRLASHPSLLVWSGSNELYPGDQGVNGSGWDKVRIRGRCIVCNSARLPGVYSLDSHRFVHVCGVGGCRCGCGRGGVLVVGCSFVAVAVVIVL